VQVTQLGEGCGEFGQQLGWVGCQQHQLSQLSEPGEG
jgi:hypothetical protein